MHSKVSSMNPNPNTSRPILAFNFLRALSRINLDMRSPSPGSAIRRSRSIKRAAYASMALTVGRRRAWSRAVLGSLRGCGRVPGGKKISSMEKRIRVVCSKPRAFRKADELRMLVPGGEDMDLCSLIEETGDYIQCLKAQVQIMQALANINCYKESSQYVNDKTKE